MLNLPDLLRSGSVKRFHIVNTTRIQTLAEHQYGVAVLAGEIAQRIGLDTKQIALVMAAALVHDAGEARTGDIPTPTKKILRGRFGAEFDQVLSEFDIPSDHPAHIKIILKCADYLDSLIFLGEHRVGRHADAVYEDINEDAFSFFNKAGEPGRHASMILSEVQNAMYQI
jgi:5'-deoxynucleotidase